MAARASGRLQFSNRPRRKSDGVPRLSCPREWIVARPGADLAGDLRIQCAFSPRIRSPPRDTENRSRGIVARAWNTPSEYRRLHSRCARREVNTAADRPPFRATPPPPFSRVQCSFLWSDGRGEDGRGDEVASSAEGKVIIRGVTGGAPSFLAIAIVAAKRLPRFTCHSLVSPRAARRTPRRDVDDRRPVDSPPSESELDGAPVSGREPSQCCARECTVTRYCPWAPAIIGARSPASDPSPDSFRITRSRSRRQPPYARTYVSGRIRSPGVAHVTKVQTLPPRSLGTSEYTFDPWIPHIAHSLHHFLKSSFLVRTESWEFNTRTKNYLFFYNRLYYINCIWKLYYILQWH